MKQYFGKKEEALVRQYIKTKDERLYENHIDPLLSSICYGVRSRYNFQPKAYYTSPSTINGCKSLMWEKLITNFDPDSGKKAYSYLTRIAHNFFCGVWRKKNKSINTFYHVSKETHKMWVGSHEFAKGALVLREEKEQQKDRQRIASFFLRSEFDISEEKCKKIFADIDKLRDPNKKAVNVVLRKHLVNRKKGGSASTRHIYKKKKYFQDKWLPLYKIHGML